MNNANDRLLDEQGNASNAGNASPGDRAGDHTDRDSQLDNVVWHALRGPLAGFAAQQGGSDYVVFDPEVNIFGAVDSVDATTWPMLQDAIGLEGSCALFRDAIGPVPRGWEVHFRGDCLQMVAGALPPRSSTAPEFERLSGGDAAEMLELAQLTEPGPFFARTFELGRYVGLRRKGKLVAMAGERFRVPGFVEISAVCTHPDVRGEGLGAALTLDVAHSIREGGDEAFLHVLDSNEAAIRIYRKLGFEVRRLTEVVFAQWHGNDWEPPADAVA